MFLQKQVSQLFINRSLLHSQFFCGLWWAASATIFNIPCGPICNMKKWTKRTFSSVEKLEMASKELYLAAKLFSAWLKGCLSELAWLAVLFLSQHSTPISRLCRFVIVCSFSVFFPIHWRLRGQQRKWGDHLYSSLLFPPAHRYSGIYLQLYIWDDYHVFSNTLLVATRLLPDELYHLVEF